MALMKISAENEREREREGGEYILNITKNFIICSFHHREIKSRRQRWAGHVVRMGEGSSAFKILLGKPTGKRPLGRPRHRWEDNIRMDLEEIGINAGN